MAWRDDMKVFDERLLFRIRSFASAMMGVGAEEQEINRKGDSFDAWEYASVPTLDNAWQRWCELLDALNIDPKSVMNSLKPHSAFYVEDEPDVKA